MEMELTLDDFVKVSEKSIGILMLNGVCLMLTSFEYLPECVLIVFCSLSFSLLSFEMLCVYTRRTLCIL